jgi:plasmid maintenance system antidote protein VapI
VKVELVKQSMTVNELAKQLDVSRDRLSLVINGKMMNEAIVSGVNNLLGINLVAVPADK